MHLNRNKYFLVLVRIIEYQFHVLAFVLKGLLLFKMLLLLTYSKSLPVSRSEGKSHRPTWPKNLKSTVISFKWVACHIRIQFLIIQLLLEWLMAVPRMHCRTELGLSSPPLAISQSVLPFAVMSHQSRCCEPSDEPSASSEGTRGKLRTVQSHLQSNNNVSCSGDGSEEI